MKADAPKWADHLRQLEPHGTVVAHLRCAKCRKLYGVALRHRDTRQLEFLMRVALDTVADCSPRPRIIGGFDDDPPCTHNVSPLEIDLPGLEARLERPHSRPIDCLIGEGSSHFQSESGRRFGAAVVYTRNQLSDALRLAEYFRASAKTAERIEVDPIRLDP